MRPQTLSEPSHASVILSERGPERDQGPRRAKALWGRLGVVNEESASPFCVRESNPSPDLSPPSSRSAAQPEGSTSRNSDVGTNEGAPSKLSLGGKARSDQQRFSFFSCRSRICAFPPSDPDCVRKTVPHNQPLSATRFRSDSYKPLGDCSSDSLLLNKAA